MASAKFQNSETSTIDGPSISRWSIASVIQFTFRNFRNRHFTDLSVRNDGHAERTVDQSTKCSPLPFSDTFNN